MSNRACEAGREGYHFRFEAPPYNAAVRWKGIVPDMVNDDVEIFSIGTELVSGLVLDTNSHWIAGEIALAGGEVTRITALADDLDAIVDALQAAVARGPRLIVTTGGLGPTPDDLTVEVMARVAGSEIHTPHEVLDDYAKRRGMTLEEVSTPPRIKMGSIPVAATLHLNPVGWAPCFSVRLGEVTLWSMPGPPREVQACFATHIKPVVEKMFAARTARMRVYIDSFESETSPFLQKVMKKYPSVYLKGYVGMSRENGLPVDIVVRSTDGEDPQAVLQRVYDYFAGVAAEAGKTVMLEPTAPLRE
jgi:molybdenum cofactor synthesis domain-containing protein